MKYYQNKRDLTLVEVYLKFMIVGPQEDERLQLQLKVNLIYFGNFISRRPLREYIGGFKAVL